MRRALASLVLAGLLGACPKPNPDKAAPPGGGAAPAPAKSCGDTGSAQVSGTLKADGQDQDLSTLRSAWFYRPMPGVIAVAVQEDGGTCKGGEFETMVFGVCGDKAGSYPLSAPNPDCSKNAGGAFSIVERKDGVDIAKSTGGTLKLETVSDSCVAGDFESSLDGQTIKGSFQATVCNPPQTH